MSTDEINERGFALIKSTLLVLYPYGDGNIKIIFASVYNHSGTIGFFFTVENETNQKIYFSAPSVQYVNNVKMRSDYFGLHDINQNEKASIEQHLYWSILQEGGITDIDEIKFTFYISDSKEDSNKEEVQCTVRNESNGDETIWKIEMN